MELNTKTLFDFDAALEVPNYDRSKVTTGIVHFGVGGFHRAHQAMYIDDLLRRGEGFDWGNLRSGSDAVGQADERRSPRAGLPLHAGAQAF